MEHPPDTQYLEACVLEVLAVVQKSFRDVLTDPVLLSH
jgi:hypothetical protein